MTQIPTMDEPEEEIELVSICCGAPEHELIEGFCSACNEGTGFEDANS
jgi:hypothetical protein